ncbi:MAG TPA: CDP-alcohol phosphatidyltransferase family protein [Solimonas sp.]
MLGASKVKIWGLTGTERLRRQLARVGVADVVDAAAGTGATSGKVLILHSGWVFDESLVAAMATAPVGTALLDESSDRVVAAVVDAAQRATIANHLGEPVAELPSGLRVVTPVTLVGSYNSRLRKREIPFLGALDASTVSAIEKRTFAASYKGVTDVVTKYVWPWPARHVTRFCARFGISPNQVTLVSLAFVIVAFFQFRDGHYLGGLLAAWIMTFLDTVDGKLARVTLQSSKFGDIFDHGIDLIHPPFWWWAWIVGLAVAGYTLPARDLILAIVLIGYVAQRLEEGLFQLLFGIAMHVWRPFDSFFRLITARRNPNLVILTVSALFGRPDIGMQIVAAWVLICFVIHGVVIVQGLLAKHRGALTSWLAA